ncbi:MAG TPA: hypothetical protein VGK99_24055 [Acidobacteriota bacterium]|jgi:hypothetical protein
MQREELEQIEQYIIDFFGRRKTTRLLTKEIFAGAVAYTSADLVRAFVELEKKWRLLVRYTDAGNDWVRLTPEGARSVGLDETKTTVKRGRLPHPPKGAP